MVLTLMAREQGFMVNVEPVTIEACQKHLKEQRTGVSLDLASMPKPADGYRAFRAVLEHSDLERIFLWFEFRKHTRDGTAKLTDALPESAGEKRIRRFIDGDSTRGWWPIDLRTASGFEPVLLTNDMMRGPLCGIDGNHRLVAQFLSGKGLNQVPVYVCFHTNMLEWAYIPATARAWNKQREAERATSTR